MTPTYGSLFSGVGGFDLGMDHAGWTCAWQVEIDKQCRQVLRHHWPDVPKYEDVRNVGVANLSPVDCITFGSPCQGLSVAGKRKGLADDRSGLFLEAIRILDELAPVGLSLRTSLVCCLPSKAKISPYAWRDSQAGGQPSQKAGGATLGSPSDPVTVSRGACVTHSFSEWPSAAVVCSLSDVLEDSVPPKYFLSPKACSGILRRAERRGKRLPGQLTGALAARADNETT